VPDGSQPAAAPIGSASSIDVRSCGTDTRLRSPEERTGPRGATHRRRTALCWSGGPCRLEIQNSCQHARPVKHAGNALIHAGFPPAESTRGGVQRGWMQCAAVVA
jgi:hypothetical protein